MTSKRTLLLTIFVLGIGGGAVSLPAVDLQPPTVTVTKDLQATLEISPAKPVATWPGPGQNGSLSPNYTASISVDAADSGVANGKTYVMVGSVAAQASSDDPNVIWTGGGTSYSVTNTAKDTANASVQFTCLWRAVAGGGGGGGGSPDEIAGSATASVSLVDSVVVFDYREKAQWATGDEPLQFSATFYDTNGLALERCTVDSVKSVETLPSEASWSIEQLPQTEKYFLLCEAKSPTPSTGKAQLNYDDGTKESAKTAKLTFAELKLKEVSFTGDAYKPVLRDDAGNQAYDAPHWEDKSNPPNGDAADAGDRTYPVTYTKDTKATISAKWNVLPKGATDIPAIVVSTKSTSVTIPETAVSIGSDIATLPPTPSSAAFPKTIAFLKPLALTWTAKFAGHSSGVTVGKSENRVYVLDASPGSTPLYESVCDVSCRNAQGLTAMGAGGGGAGPIIGKIWTNFSGLAVKRKDEDGDRKTDSSLLLYHRFHANSPNGDTSGLLANGNGSCSAWARFFQDCLRIQGLNVAQAEQIDGLPPAMGFRGATSGGFYIKVHDMTKTDPAGRALLVSYTAGQSDLEPDINSFGNHALVLVNIDGAISYYDPSYGGTPMASLSEWEDRSLSGFLINKGHDQYNVPNTPNKQETYASGNL